MCRTNPINRPRYQGVRKLLSTATSTVALGLLLSQASAQTCIHCPVESTASSIGTAFSIFAIQNGQTNNVSGGTVGACNQLLLVANLAYNPFAIDASGNPAVGAGFTGGSAHIILPNGSAVDVTPADMGTTLVGPTTDSPGITHCSAPGGTTLVGSKGMTRLLYTLTAADIASGAAVFTFQYTNGTSLLPNAAGNCILKVSASPQQSVAIAPLPTCSIQPQSTNVCVGGTVTFTASQTGSGPFTYCWQKGCPGSGPCLSTTSSLTIANAQLSDSSCYTLTVTDTFGCTTTCSATLVVNPPPSCSITPAAATNCVGEATSFTVNITSGTGPYTVVLSGCISETITGVASSVTRSHTCSAPGTCTLTANVTDSKGCVSAPCTATHTCIPCVPCIKVYKQVVCTDVTGTNCLAFSSDLNSQKLAYGVSTVDALGQEHCSAFCYRITVTNCSQAGIELRNLVITDTNFPGGAVNLGNCFPTTLGVAGSANSSASCIIPATAICDNTENIVTATAVGVIVSSGTETGTVSDHDTNHVVIVPFNITCVKEASTDGINWDTSVNIVSGTPTPVSYRVTVHNSSTLPLVVTINDSTFGCGTITVALAANSSVTTNLCTVTVTCPPGTNNVVNVSAIVDTSKTNICVYTPNNGGPVTDTTRCEASVTCTPPAACRVTGGGRQDDPLVCPADVRYVTHGGQVGAPVGNQVCSIDTNLPNFFLGNPCIHGRWTHVRHVKGGLEGNFHARFFDTLDCACIDTNLNSQTCQFGQNTVLHGVCGDRSTGPLPRKAPANKIAFTGVGDWACPNGRRESRACLFRVDIEDRGEPGNAHALASNKKENRIPDRYRIRIWVLSDAELAALNGSSATGDKWLLNFRNCISACNGIDFQDGGVGCNTPNTCISDDSCSEGGPTTPTITFPGGCPVRLPNIDDGGELLHGNHQIHPAIKECDPANPTGPGLAKP